MKLSRINTLLLVAIIFINGVTIVMPFAPAILYKFQAHGPRQQQLERQVQSPTAPVKDQPNSLIMPTALFDQQVFGGKDLSALRNGVWHRPLSSTPDKGGNTVFAAHRFTYTNPQGAFYHLDKLKVGDDIAVIWNQKKYRFVVSETKVVGPRDTYIEAPTSEPQLTLYTCTPLSLPKNRLVVIAKPVEDRP